VRGVLKEGTESMTDPQPGGADLSRWKDPTFWLAVAILVAFAGFTLLMIREITSEENTWNRLLFIYGGVEAIVFAAAGYTFGREVHRERAEMAEELAQNAASDLRVANEARLHAEQQEAEVLAKAQALVTVANTERAAALVQTHANGTASESERPGDDSRAGADAAALYRIIAVANELFPRA
jgi:hypothetical protein